MKVTRGRVATSSEITVDEDLDFLTLYKLLRLSAPASGGALRKGNKDIANAEIADAAAIAYTKLALTGLIRNADIKSDAAIAYTKLALTGLIRNADIKSDAAIALSKIVNTYLLPTILTTRGDLVYRGASYPGRIPKGTAGYVLTMGASDPGWVAVAYAPPDAGVGDALEAFADLIANLSNQTTYTKAKEIKLARAGTYRIKFDLKGSGDNTALGRVYKNGAAVGTVQSEDTGSYVTMSEDIAGWAAGDLCQVYIAQTSSDGYTIYVKNFRVYNNAEVVAGMTLDSEGAL